MRTRTPFGSLVLTCEHATNHVPRELRAQFAFAKATLASHRGYDLGAVEVARMLVKSLGAPLLEAKCSRLVVDANRSADAPSVFSEFTRDLPESVRRRLLREHHTPHRASVGALVRRSLPAIHVGVHSFTPTWNGRTRRADLGLLFDPRRPRERAFCERLRRELRELEPGLRVLFNEPYRGWTDGLCTTLRSELAPSRYIGVELELNQRLSSEAGRRATLARSLAQALRATLRETTPRANA